VQENGMATDKKKIFAVLDKPYKKANPRQALRN